MRLEGLVRLVETLSPSQLQEAAILYLTLRGYHSPELSDGWKDGGTDLRLLQAEGLNSRIVIQLSVEKKWQGKLRSDLQKAIKNYDVGTFLFISSRRLPELEFDRLRDLLKRETDVTVERVDSQSLATAFFEEGRTQDLLRVVGIDVAEDSDNQRPTSFAAESVFSYLFFSSTSKDFRDAVVEQAVLCFLADERSRFENKSVSHVASATVIHLGLSETYTPQFESVIDRLLQKGQIYTDGNCIKLSGPASDRVRTSRALNELSWQKLLTRVSRILHDDLGKSSEAAARALLPFLGAAAVKVGQTAGGAFGGRSQDVVANHLRPRFAELDARMHEVGIADAGRRSELLQDLISATTASPAGLALVAAEVFKLMASLQVPELSQALGGRGSAPVLILDSNVAIPMLANLFYGPAVGRFFVATQRLHRLAELHQLAMKLPADYLEEAATHLMIAANEYAPMVDMADLDRDFSNSTNAYVAHYSSLRSIGRKLSFSKYIAGLGATPEALRRGSRNGRQIIINTQRALFGRYGIVIAFHGRPSATAEMDAAVELTFQSEKLRRPRLPTTAKHDVRVVAHIEHASRELSDYQILCTWDRLLLGMEHGTHSWSALDPATLGDLLSITSGDPNPGPVLSAKTLAMSLTEEQSARGAKVLDWLVGKEKGALQDAEYRELALNFKREYLKRSQDTRDEILAEAWRSWKSARRRE